MNAQQRRRTIPIACWAILMLATAPMLDGAAAAQGTRADAGIQQIPAGSALPADPSRPARDVRPPAQLSKRGAGAPAQLSGGEQSTQPVAQLSREGKSAGAGPQLYRGKRTAQSADPLSTSAESRPGATVRLEGKDACDPQARTAGRPACDNVIETRAGEFVRANPLVLSREQRLLVDQRLRDAPATVESATRRFGGNQVDPNAPDAQGIASVVLVAPAAPIVRAEQDPTRNLDQEVLSIIQSAAGAVPTTPPQQ